MLIGVGHEPSKPLLCWPHLSGMPDAEGKWPN